MTAELQVQENARRHATTADQAVAAERHLGTRTAAALLVAEQPTIAWNTLAQSVERQARIAGVRDVHLPRAAVTATGWVVQR